MERLFRDVVTEKAVLSGLATYGYNSYVDVCEILEVDTFTVLTNQVTYQCMKHIFEQDHEAKIDLPLILMTAKQLGYDDLFKPQKERDHLEEILIFPVEQTSVLKYAATIRKKQHIQTIHNRLELGQEFLEGTTGKEPLEETISHVEELILGLNDLLNNTNGSELMSKGSTEYLKYLAENPVEIVGVPCGYIRLDKICNGFLRRGSITAVVARGGTGKSFFGDNVGLYVSDHWKFPTLNLDTELNKNDHIHRIISNMSDVDLDRIETGKFAQNRFENNKVFKADAKFQTIPYHYQSISGRPFHEILAAMRRWLFKEVGFNENGEANDCLIIYDYLKIMSTEDMSKNLSETQLFGFIMSALHDFAKKYSIPILTFVQTNRDGLNKEDSSVVGASDRIQQYVTNLFLWKEKGDEDGETLEFGDYKMVKLKTRFGKQLKGKDYINFFFEGEKGRITEGQLYSEVRHKIKKKQEEEEDDDEGSDLF